MWAKFSVFSANQAVVTVTGRSYEHITVEIHMCAYSKDAHGSNVNYSARVLKLVSPPVQANVGDSTSKHICTASYFLQHSGSTCNSMQQIALCLVAAALTAEQKLPSWY